MTDKPPWRPLHRGGISPSERLATLPAVTRHRRSSCVCDDRFEPRAALPLRGCLAAGLSTCRTFGALELGSCSIFGWSLQLSPRVNRSGQRISCDHKTANNGKREVMNHDEVAGRQQFPSPNGEYAGSPGFGELQRATLGQTNRMKSARRARVKWHRREKPASARIGRFRFGPHRWSLDFPSKPPPTAAAPFGRTPRHFLLSPHATGVRIASSTIV